MPNMVQDLLQEEYRDKEYCKEALKFRQEIFYGSMRYFEIMAVIIIASSSYNGYVNNTGEADLLTVVLHTVIIISEEIFFHYRSKSL